MTLVVEDGTGLSNSESYISVSDADTYHDKFANDIWNSYSPGKKEAALRKATQYIDGKFGQSFPGGRSKDSQALSWPRTCAAYEDNVTIDEDVVPQEVKNATAELALRSAAGDLESDITKQDRAIRERVDVIEVVYAPGTSTAPSYPSVLTILSRLIGPTNYGRIRRT